MFFLYQNVILVIGNVKISLLASLVKYGFLWKSQFQIVKILAFIAGDFSIVARCRWRLLLQRGEAECACESKNTF